MERPLLVYTTFPNSDAALSVGEDLVRRKLIACLNVLPGMASVYMWKGHVERSQEVVAILKTVKTRQEEVYAALKAQHPYETPVILFIEPAGADSGTLAWLTASTLAPEATVG
ncbi:divalent-cation tolerance protein CutA [Microvirga pudoricolor]|uniref:divalent-cation tolerance protein CutA n=1 Tax=Microvirga pudoricolor TaxID=2778729 RepID=UPI00194F68F7|nr:divalent-cation tolerance protein CutA [Microvirga pudoricolor]MBM6596018.1 divalent-cation tolerance protein CutA [Microvirga pudoricolor]